jgi:hypothetical protein
LYSRRAEGFTQPPAQRIEQIVKPTQQQPDAFEKLKSASIDAANQLRASGAEHRIPAADGGWFHSP